MELRQLNYFVKIAELSSFSEAAKALCISQSTLSQQIKQLEDELDALLFVRDTRHVVLSDVGAAFLPTAKQTLAEANLCKERVRDVQGVVTGTLNIGTTFSFSPFLNDILQSFVKKYPEVHLNIICHSVEELMQLLERQEVDIAFSYRSSACQGNNVSYSLFQSHLSAIVSDTHPLASQKTITLQELTRHALALPAPGNQARTAFDLLSHNNHLNYDVRMQVNDIAMLLNIVASTHLVTTLSEATLKRQKGLVAIPIKGQGCLMEGCYHVKNGAYMKYATREFIRILEENKSLSIRKFDF